MNSITNVPREARWSVFYLLAALAVLAALVAAPQAQARSPYLSTWQGIYEPTQTDNNAGGCQVCHGPGTGTVNPYGEDIRALFDGGTSIANAINQIDGDDSDGQGDSNGTEIAVDAQPGWTTGQVPLFDSGNGASAGSSTAANAGVSPPLDPVAAVPDIAVAPTTLAFGIVDVGNSNTQTTTITNNGTAVLNVTALNLSGSNEFALGTAPNTPFTVAPNGSETVDVVYTPVDNGADTGSLAIVSDDPDSPTVTVTLTGTGNVVVADACNFTVAPAALGFGNTDIGTSPTLSTTVTNSGTAACNITAIVSGSAEFALASGSPVTVAANGGTAAVTVSYTPADVGADAGNLNLTSNDNNNPQTVDVPLAGNGVEPPVNACNFSVAPTSLAFGPVTIGANSTLSTTVTNNGAAACNMTASVAAGEFTLASGATFTVAANGGTASVSVSYAPVDLGADTGNLSLASDDATNPQTVTVPLSGSGVDVAACDGITFTQAEWRTQGNGQLRVRGTGVRDGIIELFAFDPAEIIDTSRGNNGRFNFNVRNLAAVPCRVRVLQPEEGLCGEADIDNAGDDCLPLGPFVPPVEPDPLTARGDTYATPVGNPITVTAGRLSGVLYNDFGGVAPLTAQLVSGPSAGTLALGTDGGFTYTPDGSMVDNSLDQFTYVAVDADGVSSDPTTVTIQTLSKQVDFKITMNYELGMHCTGFEFAYCCVLPPYNSIVSQVIKPAQGDAAANEEEDFVDGFPRLLEGDPNVGRDGLNRETVVRDWDHNDNSFKKYQLRYYHDAQPRQEGNTGKPNESTLISAAEGNSLQYFNTVFDSAQPDPLTNALIYGPYNGVENVVQGSGVIGDVPTDNYANGWLNHFYIYIDPDTGGPNLEGHGATGAEADKIRLGVAGQVQYPANAGAGLQPLGPTGTVPAGFENVLTFSGGTGTVVYTQAKVLEDLPIMLTSPRIWEALGLPLTPFEDTIGFFADPGAVDEDVVRPYVAMKASLHDFGTGDAIMGSNGQPVIGFGTAPIDIPNCERCHSAPSINPDTGLPNVNSPNWNRPDAFYPHTTGTVPVGTGLEDMTNLEINFWQAYYDIVPGVDSDWYPRLKGAAINMLTLHDFDVGTSFTANYAGVECTNNPDPAQPPFDNDGCSSVNGLADLTNQTNIPQNTRLGAESVICQRCHADNVIANVRSGTTDLAGQFPIPPISEAIHNQHRNAGDPANGGEGGVIVFNDGLGRDGGCQGCHPAHRSDGVMDEYPITLGGDNANAGGDNRLNPGGCFVGRDVHSNPMKDIDGAETPSHLNAVGDWLNTNVANVGDDDRGIWCTNCHSQLGQELWRTEDCNDLIRGDCLVNPRAEPTLAAVAAAVGLTEAAAIDMLDPKVPGFDRTVDQTHRIWDPATPDAGVATIEVSTIGPDACTPLTGVFNATFGVDVCVSIDDDGDPSVNILSFCTTDDCVSRINANPGDQSQWRYPANPFQGTGTVGAPVPFSAATDGRDHWLSAGEPHCADCHAAPYVEQSGNITPYPPFNYPAKASLMRYTRGHQDVTCQGCHESIHGLYPVTPTIDTTSYAQAAALNNDGSHGPIKCEACHTHVDELGIPNWVDNLVYTDPTGADSGPVTGNFDRAVGWMHTYTAEADPTQDVCQNCHGAEVPEIGDEDYLRHSMDNRVSRVAMDNAERAVNNGQVFGQAPGAQRGQLCTNCHDGDNELGDQECDEEWREHLIQGRVSRSVWEDLSAPLGGCGW